MVNGRTLTDEARNLVINKFKFTYFILILFKHNLVYLVYLVS